MKAMLTKKIKETYQIKSEYFKLNKNLLEEISTKVYDEYVEMSRNETDDWGKRRIQLTYTLETKAKKIETEDFNKILDLWNPKNFTGFQIYFESKDKHITVTIKLGYWASLDVSISGTNPKSVSGLTKMFEEIISKYETKNAFFYKYTAYAIYFTIPLLIGLAIVRNFQFTDELASNSGTEKYDYFLPLLMVGFLSLCTSWIWADLFHWMFPKIEIEDSTKLKIRKYLLIVIIPFATTLVSLIFPALK